MQELKVKNTILHLLKIEIPQNIKLENIRKLNKGAGLTLFCSTFAKINAHGKPSRVSFIITMEPSPDPQQPPGSSSKQLLIKIITF